MKRMVIATFFVLCACLLSLSAFQSAVLPPVSLSGYVPHGAIVYLEAKDFSGLLGEWNQSAEKQSWLKSDN